jgi:hypothetical protein
VVITKRLHCLPVSQLSGEAGPARLPTTPLRMTRSGLWNTSLTGETGSALLPQEANQRAPQFCSVEVTPFPLTPTSPNRPSFPPLGAQSLSELNTAAAVSQANRKQIRKNCSMMGHEKPLFWCKDPGVDVGWSGTAWMH